MGWGSFGPGYREGQSSALPPLTARLPAYLMLGSDHQGSIKGSRKKVKSLSRVRLFATPWTVAY